MSILTSFSKALASAALPVAASLAIVGLGSVQSAQAAAAPHARAAVPALHSTARIALGSASGLFSDVFTEAPNGAVFYSRGSVVYVVDGNSAARPALHPGRKVLALAANKTALFVQTGLTVTAYSRSNGDPLRHWTLISPVTPITSAALYVVGGTLWSWTDWATDRSGFQFAKVNRIDTSSSVVHVIDRYAYPGDMSADSAGLYFEAQNKAGDKSYLGHASPSGAVSLRAQPNVEAPLALSAGRVDLLNFASHTDLNSFSAVTLGLLSSKRVSQNDRSIAGTGLGLLVLAQPCNGISCSSSTVSKLRASTVSVSGTLGVPDAYLLLSGPSAAVIEVSHGTMYLVRIGA